MMTLREWWLAATCGIYAWGNIWMSYGYLDLWRIFRLVASTSLVVFLIVAVSKRLHQGGR